MVRTRTGGRAARYRNAGTRERVPRPATGRSARRSDRWPATKRAGRAFRDPMRLPASWGVRLSSRSSSSSRPQAAFDLYYTVPLSSADRPPTQDVHVVGARPTPVSLSAPPKPRVIAPILGCRNIRPLLRCSPTFPSACEVVNCSTRSLNPRPFPNIPFCRLPLPLLAPPPPTVQLTVVGPVLVLPNRNRRSVAAMPPPS